jgi:hypothetical protein
LAHDGFQLRIGEVKDQDEDDENVHNTIGRGKSGTAAIPPDSVKKGGKGSKPSARATTTKTAGKGIRGKKLKTTRRTTTEIVMIMTTRLFHQMILSNQKTMKRKITMTRKRTPLNLITPQRWLLPR